MCRFYKKPILLIEFDESVPFKLTNELVEVMGGDDSEGFRRFMKHFIK